MAKKQKVRYILNRLIRRIPYTTYKSDGFIGIQHKDKSFDPTRDDESDRTFLVTVDGSDAYAQEVDKKGDDLVLEYGDKHCAITSKPLSIEGNQFYFTKDGFVGTMALNKHTLLAGDVYQPSKDQIKRKLPKDIDYEDYGINLEDYNVEETETHYEIEAEDFGDVIALSGSKKTLKEMNKAKRIRKLLEPSGIDRTKAIGLIAIGVAVGIYAYPNIIAGGA